MYDPSQGMPDLTGAEEYICARCGHPFFTTVAMIKKLPAEASPSGQEMLVPQPVFKCDDCGYINRTQFGLEE